VLIFQIWGVFFVVFPFSPVLNVSTVNHWLQRVQRAQNNMDVELKDKPRAGRPPVYDEALRHRVGAFYCQTTPLPGAGHWTLRWAEKYLENNPEAVGAMLRRSTIWKILNSQNLKPHRHKYFLQITDPDFFPKMEHLIQVYKTRKKNLFCFTPFHGSWLNMIEIWFGILTAKCLKESYSSPDQLRQAIDSFAEIWNTKFAHPFKWKYDGVGLHEKVVKRFIKCLCRSSEKLHIEFLTKQLLLMINVIKQYWDKVATNHWQQLLDLLNEKEKHLWDCIDNDEKQERKKKAGEVMGKLLVTLSNSLRIEDKHAA
jgi:hypothetical protein